MCKYLLEEYAIPNRVLDISIDFRKGNWSCLNCVNAPGSFKITKQDIWRISLYRDLILADVSYFVEKIELILDILLTEYACQAFICSYAVRNDKNNIGSFGDVLMPIDTCSAKTTAWNYSSYSISQEICTRFCCALLCCGYAIVHNEFTWSIYPYSSGLLCWHWGNR